MSRNGSNRNRIAAGFGARSHFSDFVERQARQADAQLPITHVTDAYDFRDMVEKSELTPGYCPVFDRELLYFFYGRPAYRKNGNVQANSLAAYAPIVLIFDPRPMRDASSVFPFDTGGFAEKYGDFTHHRMKVQDFQLKPSVDNIGKLIYCFYGNDRNYYDQIPGGKLKVPAGEFEAQTFVEIISFKGKNDKDDRSSTIELIFERKIKLHGGLLGVVVPQSLLLDRVFKRKLVGLQTQLLPYGDGASLTPASQIPRLQDIVRSFYVKQRLLK